MVVPGEGVVVPGGCSSPAKRPLSTWPRAAAAAAAQQSSGSESEREREREEEAEERRAMQRRRKKKSGRASRGPFFLI